MKVAIWLLAAAFLMGVPGSGGAAVRIADDPGGTIGVYLRKYERIRASRETVVIDGACASACTLVLAALPPERICVTAQASLGFHAAWEYDDAGEPVSNPNATRLLYAMYPEPVQRWIAGRGGLTSRLIYLRGAALRTMYRPCADPRGPYQP
jgi:hypothetical protein